MIFVKGVGESLSDKILESRGSGYQSLESFVSRAAIRERELSVLMAVNALASLGFDRLLPGERKKNWQKYLGFLPNPQ